MRGFGLFLGMVFAAASVAAQSHEEAARANVAIAVELCSASYPSSEAWLGAFRAAGFAERVENLGNGDLNHHFTAPADTASAVIYLGQMAPDCTVTTRYMGVTETSQMIGAMLEQRSPGKYLRSDLPGSTAAPADQSPVCAVFTERGVELPELIAISSARGDNICIEDGTSRIYIATLV
ncbi:MAG: hypothetical protein CL814_04905 [Confluentimicrobium sp.]|uniref:hypothetical protein n=1 Tax=Actibacterium sp. TaxID=1872125 RepID=UPI000C67EBD3|nr:hypothetical protein [Actibacterium sp.]MBC56255.1 hypothetical protein [Actibacterium sp.]|tara:strand:+ start:202 stop:738 length:537 start_codon:yes stop_codon:yes gene_type:complete